MTAVDDLIRDFSRSFELLSDTEATRFQRKKSLEAIWTKSTQHLQTLPADVAEEQANEFFAYSAKFIASRFSDQTEQIREQAIDIVSYFVQTVNHLPQQVCTTIVNVLVARVGQKEVTEPAEELRLKMAVLVDLLIAKLDKNAHVYLSEITQIIVHLLEDSFHEVKKQSSITLSSFAKLTEGYFHPFAEKFIKPLLHNISHQHSKVRKEVVKSIGQTILYGSGKQVDDVLSHLAQRLFDDSPLVREEVISVVGTWLLDLPDRYSFFHKFIPLLLTGVSDEIQTIAMKSEVFWNDIGAKFESENEDDLKDKQDFATACPFRYPIDPSRRPNLGCRTLIYRNLSKILPPLSRDLADWVAATRVKSAQLLPLLVLNAESCITQHLELLLTSGYRASSDEEPQVRQGVAQALFYAGHFIDPTLWWRLVGPQLRRSSADGRQLANVLRVLAQLTAGAEPAAVRTLLPELGATLASSEVAFAYGLEAKRGLLACLSSAIGACDRESLESIADRVYFAIFAVMTMPGLKDDPNGESTAQVMLTECRSELVRMAERLGMPEPTHLSPLHRKYFGSCLGRLKSSCSDWSKHSYERAILDTLCLECGPVVGAHVPDLIELFRVCLHVDKDVELRLKLFLLLAKLCARSAETIDSCGALRDHAGVIISEMLLPNCRWRAGRTSEAVRRVAVACLWTLLSGLEDPESLCAAVLPVREELLPALGSLVEDESQETRHLSCRCLARLLGVNQLAAALDADKLHAFYPTLAKRLDDSCDTVRLCACQAWLAWLDALGDRFKASPDLYAAHLQDIYRGLLVHLDDREPRIQEAVYEVLAVAGPLHPKLLTEEVGRVRHKHRDDRLLAKLLELCCS